MGYYGFFFRKFAFASPLEVVTFNAPISILIACKNEAENLEQLLPLLLQQNYASFEIILINDHSTDATAEVMQRFAKDDSRIKWFEMSDKAHTTGNKKKALTFGIQKATYDYFLFTDADCIPVSTQWISEMAQGFGKSKSIVLGYGSYQNQPTLLNAVIRYETLLTAWQYFSYAMHGLPYMGVGRNLGYTRSLFNQNNGFATHQHLKSGDDDLLVSQNATATNVACLWHEKAHTLSKPKTTWASWLHQKRRHITTATQYKPIHQVLLALFYGTQVLFYSLFLLLLLHYPFSILVLFIVLLRFIAYYYTLIPVSKKLNETDLIWKAPLLELILILLQGGLFISNGIRKPKNW